MTATTASFNVTLSPRLAHDVSDISGNLTTTSGKPFPAMTTLNVNIFNTSLSDETSSPFVDVEQFLQQKNDEFTHLVLPAIIFLGILSIIGELLFVCFFPRLAQSRAHVAGRPQRAAYKLFVFVMFAA